MGLNVRVQEQLFAPSAAHTGRMRISAKHVSILRHIVGYGAGIIMTILALRSLLMLLSAGTGNAFVDTVYSASSIFAWPFTQFFAPIQQGQWNIDVASLVGIMTYAIILTAVMCTSRIISKKLGDS